MKKPSKSFTEQYPYLAYWIEDWGEMETTNGDWGRPRISLIDQGGDVYRDYESKSHDEALMKAEKFLREVDFTRRFDKETIDSLEEDYETYKLK
jgi:hypothetical protein